MGIIAGSFTNSQSATETTHSRLVVNHNSLSCNFQLYTLGHSPICVNEVEKSLENYPYKDIAYELKKGLKFGFPLNYSGPRSPITSKNLKSVADMPELAKQKISKELATGRIAGSCSVVISVHIWGIHLKNKRIIFNVDNQAVVAIINKKSSKSNRVMTLVKSCFTVLTI